MSTSRFIAPYMDWFLNSTDAPHIFGEASALICLSTVALRSRWLEGADRVNSNLYMMVVGPSSKARKSTTIKRAREMVESVYPSRVGPTDYTTEGLFKWMNEKDPKTNEDHTALTLFASEFTADLARSAGYKNSFRDDLTNVYDGFDVVKIRSGMGKSVNVNSPRVSVFAAIAYDGLVRNTGNNDWGSGFLMRFLYLAPTEYRKILVRAAPKDPQRKYYAAQMLTNITKEIHEDPGGLGMTEEAWSMYETAFRKHLAHAEQNEDGEEDESLTTTYLHRFWPNVRKMSLLYQLDIDPHDDVGVEAMRRALRFAEFCWHSFVTAHAKTTAGDFGSLCKQVLEVVSKSGHTGFKTAVLGDTFGFSPQLGHVLMFLKATGTVVEHTINAQKYLFLGNKS